LMRIFGSDKIKNVMERLGMEEGQDIQHPFITRAIGTAQKRVEQHNIEIRKHILEYDNVMNRQREVIYDERRKILMGADLKSYIHDVMEEVVDKAMEVYLNEKSRFDEWDFNGFHQYFELVFGIKTKGLELEELQRPGIMDAVLEKMKETYSGKEKAMGEALMRHLERMILLQVVDTRWKDHLYAMDSLREGIGLRAYGQRDPLIEYQHEGYAMFMAMIDSIKEETLEYLFKVQAVQEEKKEKAVFDFAKQSLVHEEKSQFQDVPLEEGGVQAASYAGQLPDMKVETYKREEPKVGRNDPCPCGSGKKYKKCCGLEK
ncbi:MAG: preprotein translocase subunit SecA, partial [Methanothrix sp.]